MRTEGVTTMELSLFQAIELMLVTSRLRIRMRTEGVTMYTFLSKFHITKLSLPKCHFYVVTKLSLPTCHYQIGITKLSLPNCHYRIDITENPPISTLSCKDRD